MTTRALNAAGPAMNRIGVDGIGDGLMASTAGSFGNFQVESGDANVVRVPAGGEVKRMEEAVAGFNGVFSGEIVGRVAIVAGGGGMMAGFDPSIVLRAHGMAVGAGGGIVEEVGIAFGIQEGVRTETNQGTRENSED